jgi:hypothetical protein
MDVGHSTLIAFDHVWDRFNDRLEGRDDDEYFWEPVAGCWSLRRQTDGSWALDGDDGASVGADPPLTTIAWRVNHLAPGTFAHRLFGTPPGLTAPWPTRTRWRRT